MSCSALLLSVCKITLLLANTWPFYWVVFFFCWTSESLLFYWSQSNLFLEISWLKAMMAILWVFRRLFVWEIDPLWLLGYIGFALICTWVFDRGLWKDNPLVFFHVWGLLRRERRLAFLLELDRSSLWGCRNLWFFWLNHIFCFGNWFFELFSDYLFLLKLLSNYFWLGFGFLYLLWDLSLYLLF